MPVELKPQLRLEIAHVLFIDIVGYSKLLIDEQKELQQELNDIVRKTDQVREAEAEGKLMRLPTGDGMALVFSNYPEAPVECALEISKALQGHPEIKLRMGIHSGAVNSIADVNDRSNVAGAGINIAQRVMNCGDAGHILLSRHVAEDLAQYRRWQPHLHDLGDVEVKHGNRLHIFNLYTDELGNREVPEKFKGASVGVAVSAATKPAAKPAVPMWAWIGGAVLILAAIAFGFLILRSKDSLTATTAAIAAPEKSIAVLPFENRSEDKANAYFADGIQDEILTNLARIADLKVISRTSVMPYKTGIARNLREIGLQLGVAHLLEGSVQRAANRVRVNAQLIDTRTDAHLWAQTYDRDLADVFAIQSEIAKAIADQLQAKLSPNEKAAIEKPPTTDLAAFDLYSRAKALAFPATYGEQDVRQAIELLNQAVTRDPSFFEAYSQLVYLHAFAYSTGIDHTAGRLALADAALQAAVRLRPDAGETHLTRANYLYFGPRDYAGALAELETARRSLPNDPRIFELTGYILRRRGQQEEGLRNLEKALELDPRNDSIISSIVGSYQIPTALSGGGCHCRS